MTIVNPIRHGVRKIYFDLIDSLLSTDIQWEQYTGGISDTHFFLTQSLLGLTNFSDSSIFLTKYFWTQKVFRPRIFSDKSYFRSPSDQKFFQNKNFVGVNIFSDPKVIPTQKFIGLVSYRELIWTPNFLLTTVFLDYHVSLDYPVILDYHVSLDYLGNVLSSNPTFLQSTD